ncbi:fungal-specific transcription factor domain-containing protein [Dipodascopsis tothii]|uniref:fungal-specific transcription factor domain-containing protein n=1 Tax=Dipodascopsis tothii TaxID=44089 RepID=UPI0034CD6880
MSDQRLSRRARAIISCTECHRRKQKCDRQVPCNQCIARNVQLLCKYTNRAQQHQRLGLARPAPRVVEPSSFMLLETPRTTDSEDSAVGGRGHRPGPLEDDAWPTAGLKYTRGNYDSTAPESFVGHEFEDEGEESEASDWDVGRPQRASRSRSPGAAGPGRRESEASELGHESWDEDGAIGVDESVINELGYFRGKFSTLATDMDEMQLTAEAPRPARQNSTQRLSRRTARIVLRLMQTMPPQPYVDVMINIFYREANFYQALNEHAFRDELDRWRNLNDKSEDIRTPAIVFRLMSLSLQFVPAEYEDKLRQIDRNLSGLKYNYHRTAVELSDLLEDSPDKVLENILRAAWFKFEGRMKDSWYCAGKTIRIAQEIHLNEERPNCPPSYERERRRRLWWLVFYWDRAMHIVLGRPVMISPSLCHMPLPLDLADDHYYPVVKPGPPLSPFSYRVLYLRSLLLAKDLDTNPDAMYVRLTKFIDELPAPFRMMNPDRSQDDELPWLGEDRESLTMSLCMMLCALYRRGASLPNPILIFLRMLCAARIYLQRALPHQYSQYLIVYQHLEPTVLLCREIMRRGSDGYAALAEHGFVMAKDMNGNDITLWKCLAALEGSAQRLKILRSRNRLAVQAYKVIHQLLGCVHRRLREDCPQFCTLVAEKTAALAGERLEVGFDEPMSVLTADGIVSVTPDLCPGMLTTPAPGSVAGPTSFAVPAAGEPTTTAPTARSSPLVPTQLGSLVLPSSNLVVSTSPLDYFNELSAFDQPPTDLTLVLQGKDPRAQVLGASFTPGDLLQQLDRVCAVAATGAPVDSPPADATSDSSPASHLQATPTVESPIENLQTAMAQSQQQYASTQSSAATATELSELFASSVAPTPAIERRQHVSANFDSWLQSLTTDYDPLDEGDVPMRLE